MTPTPPSLVRLAWLASLFVLLAACSSSHFEAPEVHGRPAMVDDNGQPRLWLLVKLEEARQVGVGGGSRRTSSWRTDTFFHFEIRAFDPVTARPLWTQRLVTLGDPEAKGTGPSRVIGSAASGQLLGQDGGRVWLLIADQPWAVNVADGKPVADAAAIEARNPELQGLLPSEGKHYGFDQGLVLMSADARRFVVRGADLQAAPYQPAPVPVPAPDLMANGRARVVPLAPFGDAPARQVILDGQWIGLYSEKEAADAGNDSWGDHLRYPYTVLDEGALTRRNFWRGKVVTAQHFDDRFERLQDLAPVERAPVFLKGRFLKDLATGEPLLMSAPAGVLVWHSTRIDDAGRLALARLDTKLQTLWTAPLPISESHTGNPVAYWLLPGHVVVLGAQQSVQDGVTLREPHLASVRLADGAVAAWNLEREAAVP